MDNNTNFYLSGLISLSIFLLFAFLTIYMLFSPLKINSYALKKDNFISVNIVIPKVKKHINEESKKASSKNFFMNKHGKNIDVNNLFNNVWTKKIVHKKKILKPKNSKIIKEIQQKINISKDNNIESIFDKVSDIENIKTKEDTKPTSTALEVNEYLAKIQAIVYQYFKVPQNSQGNRVTTVIELSALGKVIDFRVLTYSNNIALNNEADKIKDRIKNVIFPKNIQNESSRTIVVLVSKE